MKATKEIINHLTASMNLSKKDIIIGNFLGGVAWGVGTLVGVAIVAAVIVYALKPLGIWEGISGTIKDINAVREINKSSQELMNDN